MWLVHWDLPGLGLFNYVIEDKNFTKRRTIHERAWFSYWSLMSSIEHLPSPRMEGSLILLNMFNTLWPSIFMNGVRRHLVFIRNIYLKRFMFQTLKQVREKRAELDKLKTTFVRRASEFLRNYFASLVDFMISDKSYFSQVLFTGWIFAVHFN